MPEVVINDELGHKKPPDRMDTSFDSNKRALTTENTEETPEQDAKRAATDRPEEGWKTVGQDKHRNRKDSRGLNKQNENEEQTSTIAENNNNSGFSGFEESANPVVKIQLVGENTHDFSNQYEVYQAISKSIFKTILIEDSLANINSRTLRFEVRELKNINLETITELGSFNVKCSRPLSDIEKDCSYGVVKGIDINHDNDFIKENLRLINSNLGEYLNQPTIKAVERCLKFVNGVSEPSRTIKITFTGPLPKYIRLFYHTLPVHQYNFGTMACKNCKEYGHTKNFCKKAFRCGNCSSSKHKTNLADQNNFKCDSEPFCFHCKAPHKPNSADCEVHSKALSISKNNISPNNKTVKEELKNLNKNPVTYSVKQQASNSASQISTSESQGVRTKNKTMRKPSTNISDLTEVSIDGDDDPEMLFLTSNSMNMSLNSWPKLQPSKHSYAKATALPTGTQTTVLTNQDSTYDITCQQIVRNPSTHGTINSKTQEAECLLPFSITPPSPIGDHHRRSRTEYSGRAQMKTKEIPSRDNYKSTESLPKQRMNNSFWDQILMQSTSSLSNILIDFYQGRPTSVILGKFITQAIDIVINIMNHFKKHNTEENTVTESNSGHSI